MKRKVIQIDEEKCTGCGLCIPECPEGAIRIIDGKARLISDLFCDGLGACLGHCPEGAITVEEREAEPYNEKLVMENIIAKGPNTIRAHLEHLREHGETEYLEQALSVLRKKGVAVPGEKERETGRTHGSTGCPGSRAMTFEEEKTQGESPAVSQPSQLRHWPVQMHLISPSAPHYRRSDLVLAADCVAFSMGGFHQQILKGKTLAIACPKLDEGKEIYLEKLKALIDEAEINTLTVVTMQVPCCQGLVQLARQALESASRKIPLKSIVVSLKGEVLREAWVQP
jgi:ferredoxin